ncbi:MAG: peptidylprolyl isomerase [Bacteroidetes bacterium]|jgi:peptidyl-prolyl cis-trans isomerase SurA|nr:peptidylprolyl isomerase [Bacteroidota bacterium]
MTMKHKLVILLLAVTFTVTAQQKLKVDGVAAVVGKNIVLKSDIEKFKQEVAQRSGGKVTISDCEMLDEIMTQKLLAHHAVIDSMKVSDAEIRSEVERNIAYFKQQLGTIEKVVNMYGFNDEEDLKKELTAIQTEQSLIKKEQEFVTEGIDVTPEEVRTYFKSLKEKNELPEFGAEIELAQIVLYIEPTAEETNRVIEKLNTIKKEVEAGSSMRMKAILNSDDPAVAQNGGKYTLTRESPFIKEFKEVAFSLDEKEVSDPFKTLYGFHIIQVEKISGQEIDVRHVLIQPQISEAELTKAKNLLSEIKGKIISGELTFEAAVKKYSQDDATKNNNGLIINPYTNDTSFDLTRMDPALYARVNQLNTNEMTEPFFEENPGAEKMYKLILMKNKIPAHTADFSKDYVKIQRLTLQRKKDEALNKWANTKIKDTYIKLNEAYKGCEFEKNWLKK